MDARGLIDLRRKARSDNPDVALPALVRLGYLFGVAPTTDTGWRRYGASGRLFLPAGTNYCTNPSFELDSNADGLADAWSPNEALIITKPAYSIVPGRTGGSAQRIYLATAGVGAGQYLWLSFTTATGTFAEGDKATISYYVKGSAANITCYAQSRFYTGGGAAVGGYTAQPVYTPTGEWQRVSFTSDAAGATASKLGFDFAFANIDTGDTFDIIVDDILIEKSAVLTPYFDGATLDCTWTGQANASTSMRAASALRFGQMVGIETAGTLAMRVAPIFPGTTPGGYRTLWEAYNGTQGILARYTADQKWLIWNYDGVENKQVISAAQNFAAQSAHNLVARWAATTLDLSFDSTNLAQVAKTAACGAFTSGVTVGYQPSNGEQCASCVGPMLWSPARKPDAWAAAIIANSGAAFSDPMRLVWDHQAPGDFFAPLMGDSCGYVALADLGGL